MTALPDYERLFAIVTLHKDLMDILRVVRSIAPPNWVVGGGAFRDVVWDTLHDYPGRRAFRDVDVAYFDPSRLGHDAELEIEEELRRTLPSVSWDVKNQAAVHLWYEHRFGTSVEPLTSTEEGVGTWPETVTSVGIRLLQDDTLHVIAPFGLEDMFGLILRRNPRRVSPEDFRRRAREKQVVDRWPKVKIIDG